MNRIVASIIVTLAIIGVLGLTVHETAKAIDRNQVSTCEATGGVWLDAPKDGGEEWVGMCWPDVSSEPLTELCRRAAGDMVVIDMAGAETLCISSDGEIITTL